MNIRDLIETLDDFAQEFGDDTEVRIAFQPSWPLQYNVGDVVSAASKQIDCTNELCDEGQSTEDDEEECATCEGTGYVPDEKSTVIYIGEGGQCYDEPYLPASASEELGWK